MPEAVKGVGKKIKNPPPLLGHRAREGEGPTPAPLHIAQRVPPHLAQRGGGPTPPHPRTLLKGGMGSTPRTFAPLPPASGSGFRPQVLPTLSKREGERYANKGVRSTMQWKDKLLGMTVTRGRPLGCIAGRDSHERKTFRVHHRE